MTTGPAKERDVNSMSDTHSLGSPGRSRSRLPGLKELGRGAPGVAECSRSVSSETLSPRARLMDRHRRAL